MRATKVNTPFIGYCKHHNRCYSFDCKYHHPHPEDETVNWRLCAHGPDCKCYQEGKCKFRHPIHGMPLVVQVHLRQSCPSDEVALVKDRPKVSKSKVEPLHKTNEICPSSLSCADSSCPHLHHPSHDSNWNWILCRHKKCTKFDCIFRHLKEDGTVEYRQWQIENLQFLHAERQKRMEQKPQVVILEMKELTYEEEYPAL